MTLATHGPDGPWVVAEFYANEGFKLQVLKLNYCSSACL